MTLIRLMILNKKTNSSHHRAFNQRKAEALTVPIRAPKIMNLPHLASTVRARISLSHQDSCNSNSSSFSSPNEFEKPNLKPIFI